jgi:hypothetical protein
MAQNSEQRKRRGPGRPFVKGDTRINRGGLPSEAREFHLQFRQALAAALSKPCRGGKMTRFEKGLEGLAKAFEQRRPWAVAEVLDRFIGKPKQSLEASGTEGGPLVVKIVHIGANGEGETVDRTSSAP